ncbi:MAG: FAD-dependent oxidoreductase, partial [Planctomycetaceae bacterium]|nr:FAD-dependent oxidoreductase [Planctomycetaceae bacterium]
MRALICAAVLTLTNVCLAQREAGPEDTDLVVYGATPAGIAAAIAAAEDGCRVVLAEPTSRIGGLVTSGLSHTDFHSRESLTGTFLKFASRVEGYYT